MIKISDIRKRKQVEKYCSNKYRKTLLWDAQRTVQNGSLMKTSPLKERFRTVQNGSELFAFFGTFYKERFRTVSWQMSWGCVLAHVFSISIFYDFYVENVVLKL